MTDLSVLGAFLGEIKIFSEKTLPYCKILGKWQTLINSWKLSSFKQILNFVNPGKLATQVLSFPLTELSSRIALEMSQVENTTFRKLEVWSRKFGMLKRQSNDQSIMKYWLLKCSGDQKIRFYFSRHVIEYYIIINCLIDFFLHHLLR